MSKKKKDTPKEALLRKDVYQANPLINARKGMDITELTYGASSLEN